MQRTDEDALTRDIVALASEYGRYGYRRITALFPSRKTGLESHADAPYGHWLIA
jgi:hypothetical protein